MQGTVPPSILARAMRARVRSGSRGLTPLELAIAVSVLGCAIAAMVPACVRAIHTARTAEAVDELDRILVAAIRVRNEAPLRPLASTPTTPALVPRGTTSSDPPGTWDHPTWKAIEFSLEDPHWYSYRLEIDPDPATPLRAVANGDLDGDGVLSTFERSAVRDGTGVVARPGLVVTDELE